jgi:chromosome segregation ATPase
MLMQRSHLAELRQRIIDDTNTPEVEVHQGIGDGINELNPQLKEELARLRNENVRLRAFQSQRSDDAVQQLEESLENAEQRVEQYMANHLTTKETLRQTQDTLKQTEQREKHLEYSVQQLENKLKDCDEKIVFLERQCASINDELGKAREGCSNERLQNSSLQQTVFGLQEENKIISDQGLELMRRLEHATSEVSVARRKLGQMEVSANSLNGAIEQLKDELILKQHELDTNNASLKETSLQLAALHNTVVEKDDEIAVLEKTVSDLELAQKSLVCELENERSARNHDAEEAHKALESTRDVLEQKSAAELKSLRENMNALLEDERRDNRKKQKQAQELISSQECQWKEECKKLKGNLDRIRQRYQLEESNLRSSIESEKAKLARDSQKVREEYDGQIESLKSELQDREVKYETEVMRLKDEFETKIDDLVRKGKHTMQLSKEKAKDLLLRERQSYNELVETCDNLNERLLTAANEIETARNDIDELHGQMELYKDKIAAVERERSKYQEENEQIRRQLSGRQFSDGQEAQNRLEKVTKELALLHEEHRKLKRSLKSSQLQSISESDEESRPYDRVGADGHAIQQITQEYEKKFSDLQEEKRELIMKNSAQATDITKTEMKVHECEKTIQVLKSENTTLKLQIQRADFANEEANENASPAGGSASIQSYAHSPPKLAHSSPSKIPRSSISKLPRRTSPGLDRAKRQKATSEEFLRSRIASLKVRTPPKVLSPVQSRTASPLPSKALTPSSSKIQNFSEPANGVHRLGSPRDDESTPNRNRPPRTISEAMEHNSTPAIDDPGECKQS